MQEMIWTFTTCCRKSLNFPFLFNTSLPFCIILLIIYLSCLPLPAQHSHWHLALQQRLDSPLLVRSKPFWFPSARKTNVLIYLSCLPLPAQHSHWHLALQQRLHSLLLERPTSWYICLRFIPFYACPFPRSTVIGTLLYSNVLIPLSCQKDQRPNIFRLSYISNIILNMAKIYIKLKTF